MPKFHVTVAIPATTYVTYEVQGESADQMAARFEDQQEVNMLVAEAHDGSRHLNEYSDVDESANWRCHSVLLAQPA